MCKHAETFHTNKGNKLATVIFTPISPFARLLVTSGTLIKRYLQENEALHIPIFYIKMNQFSNVLHTT